MVRLEDLQYSIEIKADQMDEDIMSDLLRRSDISNKLLKSVMIDMNMESGLERKYYYFIFEENSLVEKKYDYLVISMKKGMNPNDVYVKDIAMKLNIQDNFKLCTIVSDETTIFLILFRDCDLSPDSDSEFFENILDNQSKNTTDFT
jgi:hypothetical protein